MLTLNNNYIGFNYYRCQQCGICKAVCPKKAISLKLLHNGTHKIIINHDSCIRCKKCVNTCPANKTYDYSGYFDSFPKKLYFLGYNDNDKIRHEASSGGVCKTLIVECLKSGIIDGVYSLKRTDLYPYAEGYFYTQDNLPSYDDIPNSVYHSVMACTNITEIKKCHRLMIVGTACQLRAMERIAKAKCDELIRVCIFCKQQKTIDSTRFLAKIMGTKIPEKLKFSVCYRGIGWPGIVRVNESELPWNRAAQIPFGRRLWTIPGCDICGDSYGMLAGADISLMDPWGIRPQNDLGESLVTVHTEIGMDLLKKCPHLKIEMKSFKDVEKSLSLKDVWRKQQTDPYFRGFPVLSHIKKASIAEIRQRHFIKFIVENLPRMPILFYRILCKIPDFRNRFLG